MNNIQLRNENKFRTPIHGRNFQGTTTCVGALYPEGNVQVYWTWKWFDFQRHEDYEIHGGSRYCGFQFQNVGQLIGMWDTREIITGLPYDFSHLITTHFRCVLQKAYNDLRTLSARTRGTRHLRRRIHPSQQGRLGRKMEESMKHYKADISVRRVGIITAPRLPPDHPSVRHSSCLHREVFPAADITEARQNAIALVKYPNTPEFLNCLNFYYRSVQNAPMERLARVQENPKAKHKSIPAKANPFSTGFSSGLSKSLSTKLMLTADGEPMANTLITF